MTKRYWRISGHKGFDFDEMIPADCITDDQLKELLKCLSAKAELTYEEIIGAYGSGRCAARLGRGPKDRTAHSS